MSTRITPSPCQPCQQSESTYKNNQSPDKTIDNKLDKKSKKELKNQYKEGLTKSDPVENYVSNLRIKCNWCNRVITPILAEGILRCPSCVHTFFGSYYDFNFSRIKDRELKINSDTVIVHNYNEYTPSNVYFE